MKRTCAWLAAVLVLAGIASQSRGFGFSDEAQIPQRAVVGKPYRFMLGARNGSQPYRFRRDSGSLPPGLVLLETGLIVGTPTTPGFYKFWGAAHDPFGKSSQREIKITIDPAPPDAKPETAAWLKPGWRLVCFSEFEGNKLDGSRWTFRLYQGDTKMPANFEVKDGMLRVKVDRDNPPMVASTGPAGMIPTLMRPQNKGRVSSVETQAYYMQQYGLFEIRAKLARGAGTRSAFWMSPGLKYEKLISEGGSRDSHSEAMQIDVVDYPGEGNAINCGAHFGPAKEYQDDRKRVELPFDPTADFHLYALEWDETALVWYVDGKEVQRSDAAPHAPFFLRLSVFEDQQSEAGGYPKEMTVDYVWMYSR